MSKSKTVMVLNVSASEPKYGVGMLLVDLLLGMITCGLWWIGRLLWMLGRR